MFDGFALTTIDTGEAQIRVRHGGSGPPLLLLHGNPQTHVMWHKIAPRLARDFTVVAPDLRGYGESSSYRLALDHPERVRKLAVLDIIPTVDQFRRADMQFGLRTWHWFFLAQPADFPERAINRAPDVYFERRPTSVFSPEARADYWRCYQN